MASAIMEEGIILKCSIKTLGMAVLNEFTWLVTGKSVGLL
jgi:hypothetical protein